MVKRSESNKAISTPHGTELEQKIVYDDALIPSPEEMAKYNQIDPSFIAWFLETGKAEQNARHKNYNDRYSLLSKNINTERLFLVLMFALIALFLVASAILVWNDKRLEGSIFGAASIGIVVFMLWRKTKDF